MSKFKLVYNATSGEADEVKAILHASDALASTSNALHVLIQNASIPVTDNGGSLTVDGEVELGATTLAALENIVVSGTVELGATTLAALETIELGATTLAALENITVSATDLDIRNLVFADDKVDVTGSSVSISGTVATTVAAPATIDTLSKAVTTTSALLFTAPANMKEVKVQNNGNQAIAVGPAGVTYSGTPATDGFIIAAGDSEPFVMATGAVLHAVAKGGTQDVRVFTLAT